ncbi:TIGR02147 family protein [Bdellovibrio bacteriovorus]|uniref:TIGR02147 family protein n=1 Tax=Bdellovibrio bacteriovorus TaxID=959 RepID=UPI0035A67BF3
MKSVSKKNVSVKEVEEKLRLEFESRKKRNPLYSLRGFARALSMDPSHLSKILNKRMSMSPKMAVKVIRALVKEEELSADWIDSIQATENTRKERRTFGRSSFASFSEPSEWPFVESIDLILFIAASVPTLSRSRENTIKFLNISEDDYEKSLLRLLNARLIHRNADGHIVQVVRQVTDSPGAINSKKSEMQKQFLRLASERIDTVTPENRLNGTLTFSLNKNTLPKIKKEADRFLREMNSLAMEEASEPDCVYNLQISLYPLGFQKEI